MAFKTVANLNISLIFICATTRFSNQSKDYSIVFQAKTAIVQASLLNHKHMIINEIKINKLEKTRKNPRLEV